MNTSSADTTSTLSRVREDRASGACATGAGRRPRPPRHLRRSGGGHRRTRRRPPPSTRWPPRTTPPPAPSWPRAGSATPFTLNLGTDPACSGDTATDGYRVYSYLVKPTVKISSITFNQNTNASEGYGLYNTAGNYFGDANTAQTTGEVLASRPRTSSGLRPSANAACSPTSSTPARRAESGKAAWPAPTARGC